MKNIKIKNGSNNNKILTTVFTFLYKINIILNFYNYISKK